MSGTKPAKKPSAKPERATAPRQSSSLRALRAKLEVAEQALAAIRAGEVDAVVVGSPAGERVFTLEGADHGYRILMEAMSEGVATLTELGLITYCNARFAAIAGIPLERTIGSSIHALVPLGERERFAALLATGATARSEGEFWLQASGAAVAVPVLLSVGALPMNGAPGRCLVMTDLTEQRRLHDAVAAERAQMQERLRHADRMSSLGELAAGVAHEINNPLAYVLTSLELVIGRLPELGAGSLGLPAESTEWLRRQLRRAHDGADRVRVIVRDLKAFSRADDETIGVIDLRCALDKSIALVAHEIRLRARLVKDYDGLPAVDGNEGRLGQVFLNLLVNAAHAIPEGAADRNEIRVSGYADASGRAVVEIRDTGSGIGPDDLRRIFDPFFTTKPVGVGTGLGLSLCHAIITTLGGHITVETKLGAGTVFRVVLPAALSDAPKAAPSAPVAAPTPPRGRLLFIDDEEDICEVVQEALTRSHDVRTTTDARRAIEWIGAGERFDVILCDMMMPEMTGIDFHAKLAMVSPEQAGRMVLMSGGFRPGAQQALVALPNPLLDKPFEIDQVLALMRDMMKRAPRPSAQP